jgi:hypothetical protein
MSRPAARTHTTGRGVEGVLLVVGLRVGATVDGDTVVGLNVGVPVGAVIVGVALGASVVGEMLVGDTVVGEFVGVCSKQCPRRISKTVRGAASRQLVAPDGWGTWACGHAHTPLLAKG